MTIRLGTRGSQLALIQAGLIAERLRKAGEEVEIVQIVTEGDVRPADMSPGEGVFVAAIARALVAGEIDLAVHSAKDIPLEEELGLVVGAYPERADPRDALVAREPGATLESLPEGTLVGTDSPRRAGFLRAVRPDLRIVPLHGNVDTRLRRLDEGEVGALVLAAAGLDRLDRGDRIGQRLDPRVVAPAPAQGALAAQSRRSDVALLEVLRRFDDPAVRVAVETERAVLEATGGTCRAPVGALGVVAGDRISLLVAGVNSDGSDRRVETVEGSLEEAATIAREAGERLAAEVALR
ncbi:MAG TPA: hydroxymethylbilane synthase [Candidatus Dormibacteraeota bacterium]|jgi:hydroxymethylbilane synthase